MTSIEVSKITTFSGLDTFLTENSDVFQNSIAFNRERTDFTTGLMQMKNLATALSVDNTAYSAQKIKAKHDMATLAASLAGFAQVVLYKSGKKLEGSQLHVSITDYLQASDPEAKALAQSTHDLLNASIADLTPDYVTAADLTDLQAKIDAFNNIHGTSTTIHQRTPEQRKNFKNAIQYLDTKIVILRMLGRKFIDANPDFYSQLLKQSTFVSTHVHHTTLSITIRSKADGSIVPNATATLNNTTKTSISDAKGFITIHKIRRGATLLTVKAPGFNDYSCSVKIINGHDNAIDILI